MRKIYRSYRRWTDRDILTVTSRHPSLYLPMIVCIALLVLTRSSLETNFWPLYVVGLLFLVWQAWVMWRVVHAFRVVDWIASKKYEASGRYKLAREYHDTEFASAAVRRRRRAKKKTG